MGERSLGDVSEPGNCKGGGGGGSSAVGESGGVTSNDGGGGGRSNIAVGDEDAGEDGCKNDDDGGGGGGGGGGCCMACLKLSRAPILEADALRGAIGGPRLEHCRPRCSTLLSLAQSPPSPPRPCVESVRVALEP